MSDLQVYTLVMSCAAILISVLSLAILILSRIL